MSKRTWDLPTDPLTAAGGQIGGEAVTVISGGKPLVDWFTREEYERWIEEL